MPKYSQANSYSDAEYFFEKLCSIISASNSTNRHTTLKVLGDLKDQVLLEDKETTISNARDYTLNQAVEEFDLQYSAKFVDYKTYWWRIETLPDVKTIQPSACLVSLLNNYTAIYDRSSKAGCRVALDFILCECIPVMRDKPGSDGSPTQSTGDSRHTPTPWDKVEVHCEVSFTHTISKTQTIVGGRVDHGVGIIIESEKAPYRLFHSLLLCLEAKFEWGPDSAIAQLVVYLACLHQSRANKGRSNTSVYGVRTDGLFYVFVTITHEGLIKQSKVLSVMQGDLPMILGCFQHTLKMAMSMIFPNSMPEKGALKKSDDLELEADDPINLNDLNDSYDDEQ